MRITLHRLLNRILSRKCVALQREDLIHLHTLLAQTIIMEDEENILSAAKKNLALVVRELIADN